MADSFIQDDLQDSFVPDQETGVPAPLPEPERIPAKVVISQGQLDRAKRLAFFGLDSDDFKEPQPLLDPARDLTGPQGTVIPTDRAAQLVQSGIGSTPRAIMEGVDLVTGLTPTGQKFQARPGADIATEILPELQNVVQPKIEAKNAAEKALEFMSDPTLYFGLGGGKKVLKEGAEDVMASLLKQSDDARLLARVAETNPNLVSKMQALYEAPNLMSKSVRAADAKEALALSKQLQNMDSLIASTPEADRGTLMRAKDELLVRRNEVVQGPAFQAIQDAKRAFGDATINLNGKDVPLWENAITSRGIVLSPDEIVSAQGLKDVSRLQSSAFGTKDIVRLGQEADQSARGFFRRSIIDPVADSFRGFQQESGQMKQGFADMAAKLGITNSPEEQKFLFRAAEKRLSPEELALLTPNQQEFLNNTSKLYSDLLDRMNTVNTRFGLDPVKKRADYITHLNELSILDEIGLRGQPKESGRFAKQLQTAFRFGKERTGDAAKENVFEAVDAYINPALRRIHLTEAASQAQAKASFLPPNLRKATESWLNSAVLGGYDPKDAAIMQVGLEPIVKGIGKLTGIATSNIISGSLNIAVQQPSQVVATAVQTGFKPWAKGLAMGARELPPELLKRSNFMTARTIKDDIIPVSNKALKSVQDFTHAIVDGGDRFFARSSWYAGFEKAKTLGLTDEAAIRYADDVGRMLHANYQEVMKPAILRGQSGKAFFPLQSFAYNLFNHITTDPRVLAELNQTGKLREFVKVAGSMFATNAIYEGMGLPSPFSVEVPTELTPGALKEAGRTNLRLAPLIAQYQFGAAPLGLKSTGVVGPEKENLFSNTMTAIFHTDPDKQKDALKNIAKLPLKLIPAGRQLRDTLEGIEAVKNGYYKVGREDVDVKGLKNKLVALSLGPAKIKAVRDERKRQAVQKVNKALGRE